MNTAPSAPSRRAFSQASIVSAQSNSRVPATRTSARRPWSVRVTALCSKPEIITRSPGEISDRMARFSPWVQLEVMTTRSGGQSNMAPAVSRQQ